MKTIIKSAGKMTPTFSIKSGYTISFANGISLEFSSKQLRDTCYQSLLKGISIPVPKKESFITSLLSFIF